MDASVLREKLSKEVARVAWAPLASHNERDHLWLLQGLELVDVGVAVASDASAVVGAWIQNGQLRRPSQAEIQSWESDPKAQHFEFLIVQPFVLAIECEGPEPV